MNGFDIEDQHKLQSGAFVKKNLLRGIANRSQIWLFQQGPLKNYIIQ